MSDKPGVFCARKHHKRKIQLCCVGPNHSASQRKAKEETHNLRVKEDASRREEFLYCVTKKPTLIETVNSVSEREIYAQMLINEKPVRFHINCGATVNVLPRKLVNQENIQPTTCKCVLQMWNKTELKPEGTCRMTIRNPKTRKKYSVKFILVKENLTPLLGAKVIQQIKLIEVHEENFDKVAAATTTSATSKKAQTAQDIIEEFSDVFEGDLGTLEGLQHLNIDPSVASSIAPSRRVHSPPNRSSKLSLKD